jgi:hypothetical protein
MKPNRPKKPLQLDRHTLRTLESLELAQAVAGIATSGPGTIDSKIGFCTTFC